MRLLLLHCRHMRWTSDTSMRKALMGSAFLSFQRWDLLYIDATSDFKCLLRELDFVVHLLQLVRLQIVTLRDSAISLFPLCGVHLRLSTCSDCVRTRVWRRRDY